MQSKTKFKYSFLIVGILSPLFMVNAYAVADDFSDVFEESNNASADAVAAYQVDGSLFEQITILEQEKVLMQLEKERAQLDLELDRLAAEKIKLHMEIDTLSGRAEQAQKELETAKAKLEAEAASLARQKEELNQPREIVSTKSASISVSEPVRSQQPESTISEKYRLVNVVGMGNQLQATVEDLTTGQNKRISVGKELNGYTVKSISLDEGVVFVKDDITENLNISSKVR